MYKFVLEPCTVTAHNNLAATEYHRKQLANEAKVTKAAAEAKQQEQVFEI